MALNTFSTPAVRSFLKNFPGLVPFDLRDLPDFPYSRYVEEQEVYQVLEDWYKGIPLQAKVVDTKTGKSVERYPIKINPLKGTTKKHASTVLGQNVDSIRFAAMPFQIVPDTKKGNKKAGQTMKDALNKVFEQNALGALFVSNTIISQYLGGSVIGAKWVPDEARIEITTPSPKNFIGIPTGSDYWNLREAWVVKEISEFDAKSYGYEPRGNENKFWYLEHWTKKIYKIMINGVVLKFDNGLEMQGDNPFDMVPFVYIPHIRVDGFLGESVINEAVKGLIKELNLRWADVGDAVSDDSHTFVAIRNVRGTLGTATADGRPIIDLGATSGIANEPQPDLFSVNTKSASEPMLKLGDELYKIYRRETNHPAVADGEDEGSQRSSLTLATRMAPLVAEADMERIFLTVGITKFAKILLTIMVIKNLFGITKEMLEIPLILQWQSMLPRDREALTTEVGVRAKNKIGSIKHMMELFGDINDTEEEMEQIKEEKELMTPVMGAFGKPPGNPLDPGVNDKDNKKTKSV